MDWTSLIGPAVIAAARADALLGILRLQHLQPAHARRAYARAVHEFLHPPCLPIIRPSPD
jgi:hypothetical protein